MRLHKLKFLLPIIMLGACLEPFSPELPAEELGSLVVEGYINAGPGASMFKLSRAVPLDNRDHLIDHETRATVRIINDRNEIFPLSERQDGLYSTTDLNLPTDAQYRLDITLQSGKKYQSDLLPVKITPEIDSITWEWRDQLYLYVHTHDAKTETLFYRWDYKEDWQIQSQVPTSLTWKDDTIKNRSFAEKDLMSNCWKSSVSKGLIMTSSQAFQNDVIKFNITSLPKGAEETSVKYSIVVNQHALHEEDFNYLELMERNSSPTGSFFDPLPAQLYGNLKSLDNPDEMVIGFVGVYTTVSKTLFINNKDLPPFDLGFQCQFQQFKQTDQISVTQFLRQDTSWVPHETWIDAELFAWVRVIDRACVDCRVYGSTKKPDYWD